MSTDTLGLSLALDTMAVSQYLGLPFTSFLHIGGKIYGTAPDGLYCIEGPDDAGSPIRFGVDMPMTDSGSTQYKRARTVTLSGRTENALASILYDSGQEPTMGEQQRGGRFAVGRDGAGRALQCRIRGEGPTEITGITVDVLTLGNKARG
jgi:hypothetical protein